MKKTISLILILILMLSCCACGSKEIDPEKYISEAALTECNRRIDENQIFYNKVFVRSHLPVNEKKSFKKDGKTWAPVVVPNDYHFNSYKDLYNDIYQTYTKECADKILKDYPCYADIDGVFCFDMAYADKVEKGPNWTRNNDKPAELKEQINESGTYVITFNFVDGKGKKSDKFTFLKEDNGYHLTEFKTAG